MNVCTSFFLTNSPGIYRLVKRIGCRVKIFCLEEFLEDTVYIPSKAAKVILAFETFGKYSEETSALRIQQKIQLQGVPLRPLPSLELWGPYKWPKING